MKKLFSIIFLIALGASSFAQPKIKISALPEHTGSADAGYLAIVVDNVTKKTLATNVNKTRVDSVVTALAGKQASITSAIDIATRTLSVSEFTTTTPSTPTSSIKFFDRKRAGLSRPAVVTPEGTYELGAPLFEGQPGYWIPFPNSTAVGQLIIGNSVTGTATARALAPTNLFTSAIRLGHVSAATAGSAAGTRGNQLGWWRGNAAGLGGFHYVARVGVSSAATVADQTYFAGMYGSAAAMAGNVQASSLTNIIGLAKDGADANAQFMHNDGSGTATKIDLGANFPGNTLSTDVYEVQIYCKPNSASVHYSVLRVNTGDFTEGEITSNLPANTQFLSTQIWTANVSTAAAAAIDIFYQYIRVP
jgi:hypothetical protein